MTSQEIVISEPLTEAMSTQDCLNDDSDDKNKEVYFLILRPSEEKIDFTGLKCETKNNIKPSIIFQKRIDKGNETYLEEIVFKFKKKQKKKKIRTKQNQPNML